jgi:hypothetical protein
MPVALLRLTDERLRRLGRRLFNGEKFTVTVPEGVIEIHRQWRVVLVASETDRLDRDDDEVEAEPGGVPSVIAIARLRGSGRPSTTDERVLVADPHILEPPLPIRELVNRMPSARRPAVRQAAQAVGAELDDPLGAEVLSRLVSLRPELAQVVERLTRFGHEAIEGEEAPILAMERDAFHLALAFAGFKFDDTGQWSAGAVGGYLSRLQYQPLEESLSGYDAARFPGWEPLPGERTDWTMFTDGKHYMRIGDVNDSKLEIALGVDLIYRHLHSDTFVLVQYKKMSQTVAGKWGYRPDAQLKVELERMRMVDGQPAQPDVDPRSWRLFPKGCFVKIVRPPDRVDPTSDHLLPGIYMPIPYLDAVLASGEAVGERGGQWLGYDTVDRYVNKDLFVALVRQGWIGTQGVTTRAIEGLVDAAVGQGRSVMIAEDAGEQTGRERRGRPRAVLE